jgi:hypothetical protein
MRFPHLIYQHRYFSLLFALYLGTGLRLMFSRSASAGSVELRGQPAGTRCCCSGCRARSCYDWPSGSSWHCCSSYRPGGPGWHLIAKP